MSAKGWLLTLAVGLTVLAISAVVMKGLISSGPGEPREPAPTAPPAPEFQPPPAPAKAPEHVRQPADAVGPRLHEVKKPLADEQPAYGLPLQIQQDTPEVPPEVRGPTPVEP